MAKIIRLIMLIFKTQIYKELFYVLSAALVVFAVLEIFFPGIASAFLNINWVLILWFIVGIIITVNN